MKSQQSEVNFPGVIAAIAAVTLLVLGLRMANAPTEDAVKTVTTECPK